MSLLLESGHPHAPRYPLATVWTEAEIVRERFASRRKMDAVIMQMCIASIATKKAGKELQGFLDRLNLCD